MTEREHSRGDRVVKVELLENAGHRMSYIVHISDIVWTKSASAAERSHVMRHMHIKTVANYRRQSHPCVAFKWLGHVSCDGEETSWA